MGKGEGGGEGRSSEGEERKLWTRNANKGVQRELGRGWHEDGGVEHRVSSRRRTRKKKQKREQSSGEEGQTTKGARNNKSRKDPSPKKKVMTPGRAEGKERWERNLEQSGRGDGSWMVRGTKGQILREESSSTERQSGPGTGRANRRCRSDRGSTLRGPR